jgi:hypothetical protein
VREHHLIIIDADTAPHAVTAPIDTHSHVRFSRNGGVRTPGMALLSLSPSPNR